MALQDQEVATFKAQAATKAQEAADLQAAMVSAEEQTKLQVCSALCCCQLVAEALRLLPGRECIVALIAQPAGEA
jgi:hypothetical protein